MFVRHLEVPNVVIVPIAERGATWDVFFAWQRGKITSSVRALIDALDLKVARDVKPGAHCVALKLALMCALLISSSVRQEEDRR